MLSLYASQQRSVTEGSISHQYTFFKDDREQNSFYVLPGEVSFIMDNGKPRFSFIKYRGETSDPNSKGGFCVFSIALDITGLNENLELKKKLLSADSTIVKAIKQRAQDTLKMCVAKTEKRLEEYERFVNLLGYSTKEADSLVEKYKSGEKTTAKDFETLPNPENVIFLPVPFTECQVSINLEDFGSSLIENVINPASPNLVGNHSTVFTVIFSQQGATLFEKIMKEGEGAGVVTVSYSPKFEARLPPATVTVTYKSQQATRFISNQIRAESCQEDKSTRHKIRNDFFKENLKIEIEMGSVIGLEENEINVLQEKLENWGKEQVQDILNSKLTIDPSTLTEGSDEVLTFFNQMSAINDFTRVLTQKRSSIYSPGSIAMQLPTIKSIISPDDSVDNYFQEINTLDPFFQDQEMQVSVNTNWEQLGIFSIEVKLYYGPDMAVVKEKINSGNIAKDADNSLRDFEPTRFDLDLKELVFSKDRNTISEKQTWAKVKDKDGRGINNYIYSYQVYYSSSSVQFQSPCYFTDDPVLTIPVENEVLQVKAEGNNLVNWEIVQSVKCEIDYQDQAKDIRQQYSYLLDEDNPAAFEPKPIGAKRTENVNYRSTFYLNNGREITIPQTGWTPVNQTGKIDILVDDPFSGMTNYTFIPKMGNIVDFIGITANYVITSLNFQMTKEFTFSDEDTQIWNVPVVLDDSGSNEGHITFSGVMRVNGQMQDISGDDGGDNFVLVGPDNILTVEFSPIRIDFNKYAAVSLFVKYQDKEEAYDFASVNDQNYKFNAVVENQSDKCQYRLELIDIDSGETVYVPGNTANDWSETNKGRVLLFLDIKKSGL